MRPQVTFLKSGATAKDFIQDKKAKIILAGRSNVGKSSLINRMAGVKNIARVSSTPGKTAFVNYYQVNEACYWVDLPGYGYAKVSGAERERWGELMEAFFGQLDDSYFGVLIVDIRHKPTEQDMDMADLFRQLGVPFLVVANKLDKLKNSQIEPQLSLVREALVLDDEVRLVPFSAEKGSGKQELAGFMRIEV